MSSKPEFQEVKAPEKEEYHAEITNAGNETVKEMTDYKVVGGKPAYAGFTYQLKLLMLFFCWGDTSRHFRLATEIEAAGKFDDLLFEYENEENKFKYVLLQAKHSTRKEEKAINMEALKNVKNGAYSMQKYFSSYMEIRNGGQIAPGSIEHIILFTNVNFHESLLKRGFLRPIQNLDTFFHCKTQYDIQQFYEFTTFPEELLHLMIGSKTPDEKEMECVQEFRGKLIFAVNQPDEQDIECTITEWLGNNFNLTNCEFIFARLLSEMTKWMAAPAGSFRTNEDKAVFFKKIKSEIESWPIFGVYSKKTEKKKKVCFFEDECLVKLEAFLNEGKYMRIFSNDVSVSCMKVIQILQHSFKRDNVNMSAGDYVVINVEDILVLRRHLMKSLKEVKQFLFVIEWSQITKKQTRIAEQLVYEILKESQISKNDLRLVIITNVNDADDDEEEWTCYHDSFTWDNLTEYGKEKIRNFEITFNGKSLKLSDLLTHVNFQKCNAIGEILNEIIEERDVIVGKEIHDSGHIRNYYIPRAFQVNVKFRFKIDKNCFKDIPDTELFVISGYESNEFDSYFHGIHAVYFQTMKHVDHDIKVILLDDQSNEKANVLEICKTFPFKNIHWLIKKSNEFEVKMSSGKKYLDENEIVDQTSKVNVVFGTAGIGKSTVLINIGEHIKQMKPNVWVVKFNLIKYASQFSKVKNETDAIEFLSEIEETGNVGNKLSKTMFQFFLKETGNVVLLLDGFDEICPDNETGLIQMVEFYKQTKIAQIWITTRTHFKDSIGTNYTYELVSFSDRDQEIFFTKFWENTLKSKQIASINDKKVALFVKSLLRVINDVTKGGKQEIVGNALQALLIANGYKDDFLAFHNGSEESVPNIQTAFGIALYRKFVENKFSIYIEEKIGTGFNSSANNQVMKELLTSKPILKAIRKYHQKLALQLLFPKRFSQFFKKDIKMPDASIIRMGIIENLGDGYRFIHRTFAEFFLAELLANIVMKRSSCDETEIDESQSLPKHSKYEIAKVFLYEELLNPVNRMLQRFLDEILIPKSQIYEAISQGNHDSLRSLIQKNHSAILEKDGLGRNALHWACMHERYDMVKDIYYCDINFTSALDDLGFQPIIYAAATGKIKIIEFLLSKLKAQKECQETLQKFFKTINHSAGLDMIDSQDCVPKWISHFKLYEYQYLPDDLEHWVTLYLNRSNVLAHEQVPGIFYLVNITTQHKMLAMSNYELIKNQLISCKSEKLYHIWESFVHSGLNTNSFENIQRDISEFNEFGTCFHLSVKQKNYSMLAMLIKLSTKEKQIELWQKTDWRSISKEIINHLLIKFPLSTRDRRAARLIILLDLLRIFHDEAIFDSVPWFQFFNTVCSGLRNSEIAYYMTFFSQTLLETVLNKYKNEASLIIQFKTKGLHVLFSSILKFITDNCHEQLQNVLQALTFVERANHCDFLTCFWENSINNRIGDDLPLTSDDEDRLTKFVQIINVNKDIYFHWNAKKLIGENLILDLIAGAYDEQVHCFCEDKDSSITIITNIVSLYDKFVDNKFFQHTKGPEHINMCLKEHECLAFHLLFPEKAKLILQSEIQKPSELLFNIGLIAEISGQYYFKQHTFAEYFVARYIFEIFAKGEIDKENIAQIAILKVFLFEEMFKERNETLRAFLDYYFTQELEILQIIFENDYWKAVITGKRTVLLKFKENLHKKDLLGRSSLHLICLYDFEMLYTDMLTDNKSLMLSKDFLNFTPVCYACASANHKMIQTCMELISNCSANEFGLQPIIRILNDAPTVFKLTYLAYWISKCKLQNLLLASCDNYVEMFLKKLEQSCSKLPNVFFAVDIEIQLQMLKACNYVIIKQSLKSSHSDALWQITYGLNKGGLENNANRHLNEIKSKVSSLPELRECFENAISCENFNLLEALIHLTLVKERKELYEMHNYVLLFSKVTNDNKKVFTIFKYDDYYSCRQIIILDILSIFPDDNLFASVDWFRFFSILQMCGERFTGNVMRYLSMPLWMKIVKVFQSNDVFMRQFNERNDAPFDFILECANANSERDLTEIFPRLKNISFWCY